MASEDFSGGQADFLHVRIVDVQDGLLTAKLDGELSHATRAPALELLTDAVNRGESKIVLDLSDLGFCDSAGLRLLIQLNERARAAGGWLRLAAPTPSMSRILAMTNLDRVLALYPSVRDAVDWPTEYGKPARTAQ